MSKIAAVGFFVFILSIQAFPTRPASGGAFADWPLDGKLDTAWARLEAASRAAASDREREGYRQAMDFAQRSRDEYLAFRGAEAPVYAGSTDPADCPFGLMKVMRVCTEDLLQANALWQRSPRPRHWTSTQSQEATEAITTAVEAFARAIQVVEGLRGWKTHAGHNGIIVICPPEFKVRRNENFPLALHVRDARGKDERVVLITWKYKPTELTEWQFQDRAIAAHQKDFSDFQLLESRQQWLGVPGYWFRYRYAWEGQDIMALIYQNAFGTLPWELRYLAVADQFDIEECEEIVRSLKREL